MAKRQYTYDYPRPMVTVDGALFRIVEGDLQVLLIKRKKPPFKGRWALPGGFIQMNESLEDSALRELAEETGIRQIRLLTQLGAYGDPKRDPRGRVITIAFVGVVASDCEAEAGDDAAAAEWLPLEVVPETMACDHQQILADAIERLVVGSHTTGLLFAFLPDTFTLDMLQWVLDIILGEGIAASDYLDYFIERKLVRRMRGGKKFRLNVTLAE